MTPKILSVTIVVLSILGAAAQSETTTLIIPIYNQTPDYWSGVTMIEVQGRRVHVRTDTITEYGTIQAGGEVIGENSFYVMYPVDDIGGSYVGNGWARILVPENRQIHAEFSVGHKREPRRVARFIAMPPARSFRLWGRNTDDRRGPWEDGSNTDIALSIVNPTDEEQTVTVTFHRVDPSDSDGEPPRIPRTIQGELKVPAMHRVSRFLAELVPIGEKYPEEQYLRGVVRIEGETEIAVAALQYFWGPPLFWGIPVVAE